MMPATFNQETQAAQMGFAAQERELGVALARQPLAVITKTASGSGDLEEAFSLDHAFRLVFVRCHFSGSAGTAPMVLSVDSGHGSAYDARLFTVAKAGVDADVHLRIGPMDNTEPSAWTFQAGDALLIQWSNPDSGNITWGLEVGLAVTS